MTDQQLLRWLQHCERCYEEMQAHRELDFASGGICELCYYPRRRIAERECKLICENCGARRDCSDP